MVVAWTWTCARGDGGSGLTENKFERKTSKMPDIGGLQTPGLCTGGFPGNELVQPIPKLCSASHWTGIHQILGCTWGNRHRSTKRLCGARGFQLTLSLQPGHAACWVSRARGLECAPPAGRPASPSMPTLGPDSLLTGMAETTYRRRGPKEEVRVALARFTSHTWQMGQHTESRERTEASQGHPGNWERPTRKPV